MRGRPSPYLSLILAASLLVPVISGGMGGISTSPVDDALHSEPPEAVPPRLSPPPASESDPYVDLVVAFLPGDEGAARADPARVLGLPDRHSVGLGRSGCLLVAFTDGLLENDPGDPAADLRIHAAGGTFTERAWLSVSLDGALYDDYGELPDQPADIDLSERTLLERIRYLRVQDLGTNVYSTTSPGSGWDIDAIEALCFTPHVEPPDAVDDTGLRILPC